MVDVISFDAVQPIDFKDTPGELSEAQKQYEYDMQEQAGVEPSADFIGVRNSLAQKHKQEEDAEMYEAADIALQSGAEPAKIADAVQAFENRFNEEDYNSSLEVEAGRNNFNQALTDDEVTRSNAYMDGTFDTEDFAIKDKLRSKLQAAADQYVSEGNTFSKISNTVMDWMSPFMSPAFSTLAASNKTKLADIAVNAIPFWSQAETASIGEAEGVELSAVTTGERQKAEYLSHYLNDTPEEFGKYIDSLIEDMNIASPTTVETVMQNLFGTIDDTNDIFNIIDVVDVAGSAAGITKALRGGYKSIAVYDKVVGNTRKAADKVTQAITKGDDVATALEDGVTVSATQPFQAQGLMAESNRIAEEVADVVSDEKWMTALSTARKWNGMTDEEKAIAENIARDSVKTKMASVNDSVVDVQAVSVAPDESGAYRMRVSIGGGLDGKAGMSKKAAQNLTKKLELAPEDFTINKKDGQGYYIDVDRSFREGELIEIGKDPEEARWAVGALKRTFAGRLQISEKAHGKDITAFRTQLGLEQFLRNEAADAIKGLGKQDAKEFKAINKLEHRLNSKRGRWLTDDELREHGVSEAVIDAHRAYKKAEDFEYIVNNDKVRKDLVARGYKTTTDGKMLVKPVDINEKNFGKVIIKDINTWEDLEKRLKAGDRVVQVHRADVAHKSLNYTHKLIKADEALQDLPRFITPYQGGGRRRYTWGTAFVKIGSKFSAGGREVNGFARTLKAGMDTKELKAYADEINKLIDIHNTIPSELDQARAIAEADFKLINVDNVADMRKLIKSEDNIKGIIDPSYKAQVLEDGWKYDFGNNLDSIYDGTERLHDSLDDLVRLREESFNGRDVLLDQVNGREAKMVHPIEIWDQTIRRASSTATMSDLHKWYQREFRRRWEDLVEGGKYMSDGELLSSPLIKDADPNRIRAAKAFQQHYLRLTNAKSGADKYIQKHMETLGRWLGDKNVFGKGRQDWESLAKSDPVAAIRTAEAYHVFGGNMAQLWKQPMDLLATTVSHPINMLRTVATVIPSMLGVYARRTGNAKMLNHIGEMYGKVFGVDMKRLAEYLDTFGSFETVGRMDQVLNKNFGRGGAWKGIRATTLPFQIGQGAVNVLTDIVAFLDKGGKDFVEIAKHADDLTRNMTKVSESAFQYGQKSSLTKLMSQWSGYMSHSLEAMGNKALTKRERAAMVGTQLVALGGLSTLGQETAANAYRYMMLNKEDFKEYVENTGLDYDDLAEGFCYGLLHNLAKEYGIDFNEDLGISDQIDRLVGLFDKDLDDQTKVVDFIPSTQAGRGIGSIIDVAKNIVKPSTDELDVWVLANRIARDKDFQVGARALARAAVVWQSGMFINSKGEEIANIPLKDRWEGAVKAFMGFKPYENFINNLAFYDAKNMNELTTGMKNDMMDLAADIKAYKNSTADDPLKAEETLNNLYKKYDDTRLGYARTLEDMYGSQLANRFAVDSTRFLQEQAAGEKTKERVEKYDNAYYQYLEYKYKQMENE